MDAGGKVRMVGPIRIVEILLIKDSPVVLIQCLLCWPGLDVWVQADNLSMGLATRF